MAIDLEVLKSKFDELLNDPDFADKFEEFVNKKEQQRKMISEIMEEDAKDGLYDQTWDDIEDEYQKDNYPPFGGPFTDALDPFTWLRAYYHSPLRKKNK